MLPGLICGWAKGATPSMRLAASPKAIRRRVTDARVLMELEESRRIRTIIERMTSFTHFDSTGQAHMVGIGEKSPTHRRAVAEGRITMKPETLALIRQGDAKKGDVLGVARIAAIQAAKKTADLIPLCHPLMLSRVAVDFELLDS